jgi:plasmid maintenance system antidote protein VapI
MPVTAIHPGEHLAEELKELGMSAAELARQLDVPTNRVTEILNGTTKVRQVRLTQPGFAARLVQDGHSLSRQIRTQTSTRTESAADCLPDS